MFFQGNEKYNCATYLRLSRSDGDQQESNSIKNQRALLNDYMGKHPELHKFDEYVDDGYSGTNFERPDFKRMIEMLQLLLRLGTFQVSDIVYNTLGGMLGGLCYIVGKKVHERLSK